MAFNEIKADSYTIQGESISKVDKLPVGTYVINFHPDIGYYVTLTKNFVIPSRIYGNNPTYSNTIVDRFLNSREGKVTAATLSGVKGSGKTLCAKQVANLCREEHGICTFILSNPFSGNNFNEFLISLQKNQQAPIIIFADEFEKVYQDQDSLDKLLTLLDGTATLHMLALLTMNSSLDDARFRFFKNRPGRSYFNIHFLSCPEEVIVEYCEDNLKHINMLPQIINFSYRFDHFTLDLLTTLVIEINLTNGSLSVEEIAEYANLKPDFSVGDDSYETVVFLPSGKTTEGVIHPYEVSEILRYHQSTVTLRIEEGELLEVCRKLADSKLKLPGYLRIEKDSSNKSEEVYLIFYELSINSEHKDVLFGKVEIDNRTISFEDTIFNLVFQIKARNFRQDQNRRLIL